MATRTKGMGKAAGKSSSKERQNHRTSVTQRAHSRPPTVNASGANIPDPRCKTGQEMQKIAALRRGDAARLG
jgi:hypothetical protein